MIEDLITEKIIGCAMKVHSSLGPGLLESVYEECLYYELCKTDLIVERQKPIPLIYESIKLECGFRADLLVDNKVIVELKAAESITNVFIAQVLTYLRITGCKIGLLINFNVKSLKDGIKRVIYTRNEINADKDK